MEDWLSYKSGAHMYTETDFALCVMNPPVHTGLHNIYNFIMHFLSDK